MLLTVCGWAIAQSRVTGITIRSGWGGPLGSQEQTVSIRAKNGVLQSGSRRVAQSKIERLVSALRSPIINEPEPANLGLSPAWLDEQIADPKGRFRLEVANATERQRALLAETLKAPETPSKVVPLLFKFMRTGGSPWASVVVTFDDGRRLEAATHSYYSFMLPWSTGKGSEATYNADISRAVADLLEKNSPTRKLLLGSPFAEEFVQAVRGAIRHEWNLLGTEDRAGEALKTLRTRYEVVAAEIHSSHNREYGTAPYKGEPKQDNLHARLRKPSFPPSVAVALALQHEQGRVPGVERFLDSVEKYETLALSVPWLRSYIEDHPLTPIRISYVQDSSFSDKALSTFAADMQLRGRPDLIEKVRSQQQDIVLLVIQGAYWLVFPDKHMLLWRYEGPAGLLKWTSDEFPAGECAEYGTNHGGCSGREVKPDGTLGTAPTPRDQVCMAGYDKPRAEAVADEPLFQIEDRGLGGFIDKSGRIVIPPCFDIAAEFSEGLASFERDQMWGYLDRSGKVVIEPRFLWAEEFSEGLARVQIAGSRLGPGAAWGFIDRTGAIVIDGRQINNPGLQGMDGVYGRDRAFRQGRALIEIDGKKGFIDKSGRMAIPPRYTYAYPFSEGLAAVTMSPTGDDGWGHIDVSGQWVVQPRFGWASSFSDGLAPVNRVRDCGYVDRTGAVVVKPPLSANETDCAAVWGQFADGLARWKFGKKYGFIDQTGKTIISPKFDLTFGFSEGLAAVLIRGKWSYIDTEGRTVIQPMSLRRAEAFRHGLASVSMTDGRSGYIDRAGKFVWISTPPEP